MTAAIAYLPNIAAACDRITARDRAENIRVEAAEKLRDARAALRSPSFYSNDELRAFCVTLQQSDDPDERGMDWLNADAMGYNITPNAKPRRIIAERDQLGAPVWRAHCDDLGSNTSPYGYGATEAEAIADLERLLEEAA